ncbi:hypothetical protein [Shimia thalassica]|uniref:hypothetical protein n=1 Tax=Shimia thalassica TaxID=1715693 RepID=UPI0027339AAB|nr:hypothetical protein [Shimia thalassica]MDP2520121.1 hypothetical protein [Shimia thalassica]
MKNRYLTQMRRKKKILTETTDLKIDGNGIKFFSEELTDVMRLKEVTETDPSGGKVKKTWELSFFGNETKTSLFREPNTGFEYGSAYEFKNDSNFKFAKLVAKFGVADNWHPADDNSLLATVKGFLENNSGITRDSFFRVDNMFDIVMSKGAFVLIYRSTESKPCDEGGWVDKMSLPIAQFERSVILNALATSTNQKFRDNLVELSNALRKLQTSRTSTEDTEKEEISDLENVLSLYKEFLLFDAVTERRNVVGPSSHQLPSIWNIIRKHHKIEEYRKELSQKLASISSYLSAEADRAARIAENKAAEDREDARVAREEAKEQARIARENQGKLIKNVGTGLAVLITALTLVADGDDILRNLSKIMDWIGPDAF